MGLKESGLRRSLRNVSVGIDAIPDSEDLHARYDFRVEDGSLPVTDQTGNGNDLDSGSYSGVGVDINGKQAGLFDDDNDDAIFGDFSALSQPNHIFASFELVSDPNDNSFIYDSQGGAFDQAFGPGRDNGAYGAVAGSAIVTEQLGDSGDIVVSSVLFNGENSSIDLNDGTATASGDAGSETLDGFRIGSASRGDTVDYTNVKVGEVLVYSDDKSDSEQEIIDHLTQEWGPTQF